MSVNGHLFLDYGSRRLIQLSGSSVSRPLVTLLRYRGLNDTWNIGTRPEDSLHHDSKSVDVYSYIRLPKYSRTEVPTTSVPTCVLDSTGT